MNDSPGILIIRLSSLGDILHTLPAFSGLRASFPGAKIDWLSAKKSVSLLSAVRGIDEIHVLDTGSLQKFPPDWPAWSSTKELVRKLRARNYDYAIDFQGLLKTGFLAFLSGSRTRLGFSRDLVRERPAHWFYNRTLSKPDTQFHVLELNRKLAGLTGGHIGPTSLDFAVREEDAARIDSLLAKEGLTDFVIINPGGGWPTKRWNLERYGDSGRKNTGQSGIARCRDDRSWRGKLLWLDRRKLQRIAFVPSARIFSSVDPVAAKSAHDDRRRYRAFSSRLRRGNTGSRHFRPHVTHQKRTLERNGRGGGAYAALQLLLWQELPDEK